ncbi:MAG: hypothetical protein DHS20C14_02110 [Phycisphaeraceae bacterium]|nr:MAG: hypothetical protein DHS20C14_02110 [Phycisphaeraceae bacterium]
MTRAPDRLAWTAAALIAIPALLRAGVAYTPFPYWDGDPFLQGGPLVALGPTAFLALDLAACVGCGLALLACGRVARTSAVLFALGAVAVIVHIARSPEHAGPGSAWVGAMATGLGAWHLGRFDTIRRAMVAAALGFIGLLTAKGALQYFVEHQQTLDHFRDTQSTFFEARGWAPGSRSAEVYLRRLRQPAATGWFGLSNVYATFVGAGFVALAIAGFGALRAAATRNAGCVLLAGAIAGAGGLAMTGSKGAWAAAGLGIVVGVAFAIGRNKAAFRRAIPWAMAAIPLATIGAIGVRGVIGERSGELSVLFRSFYLHGAARIFGDHPLLGVGPGGFKDAYILARPPLSPEEVTSSHAVLVDWGATLGVLGLAWGVLFLLWAWHAGRVHAPAAGPNTPIPDAPTDAHDTAQARAGVVVAALVVVAVSALVEREATTPDAAAMRAIGLIAWLAIGWGVLKVWGRVNTSGPALGAAGVGAATVILAHTQLDMSAISEGSAALAMLWLGVLIAPAGCTTRSGKGARATSSIAAALPAIAGVVVAVLAIPPVWAWESALRDAARPALLVAQAREEILLSPTNVDSPVIAARLAADLNVTVADPSNPQDLFAASLVASYDRAIGSLDTALTARPGHHGTRTALTNVLLQRAAFAGDQGAADALVDRAIDVAENGPVERPGSPSAWMWAGAVRAGLADTPGMDPARSRELLEGARAAWERAAALDPGGPDAPARLMRVCERLGDLEAARLWAARAIEADANMRLDELKQLTGQERVLARRLLSEAP